MKNPRLLLNEVLKDIEPDEKYQKEIFSRIDEIIKKINKNKVGVTAVLGGSGAKGTWLKTFDADIFALFDYKKYSNKSPQISDVLEKILKKSFKIIRLHGSRDYFQIKQNEFTFEIVPILRITKAEQAKNITDVSPLHSNWVSRHKKLVHEMKLAKQFAKSNNLYGAESHLRGFSGYVCEILTVNYGSFQNLLKNAQIWKEKTVIDVQKFYKRQDVFKIVNTSKLTSPLIVIDPVQKDRNAAAALSIEKFNEFKDIAKKFLKDPSKEFFKRKVMKDTFPKSASKRLLIVKSKLLDDKIDIAGSKIVKINEFLSQRLQKNGFRILRNEMEFKERTAFIYYLFPSADLEKIRLIEGPPLKLQTHAANFKKIHRKTFVKKGKVCVIEARKFTNPGVLLRELVKDPYIRQRCKSIGIEN